MYFKSQKASLILLGVTSLVCSRVMFFFFNDPEGPNLLVVVVAAAVIYLLSLAAYRFIPLTTGTKKLLLVIFIQMLLTAGLYFCLS